MLSMLKKVFPSKNDRELKKIRPLIVKINELENSVKALSDEDLKAQTGKLKERFSRGETLDQLLPEAFATVREGSRRIIGQRHFDVQLIGGMVLNSGRIAEMRTGEGKTLTATAPCYLNALSGKGVHVITVNDYLAKRDSEWMGRVYGFLGLSTGIIVHGLNDNERRTSYASDITYGTNNEFGFDYLRDNMRTELARFVQRGHNFAIVDEVDSILIDEARTPLIISGPTDTATDMYVKVNVSIPGLQKDSDYTTDEKSRSVALTEDGISKLEKRLRIENLYDPKNIDALHHVQQALKAHVVFKKDVDYVVRDGKVVIVDEFTGRLMPGRRYSDGLHAALEAKEHVTVERETQTMATITFQNYFRMYSKLSGMTGTADTEAVEFKKIYNLDVMVIPTNRNMIRKDHDDVVYRSAREKFNSIADEIELSQKKGQPVLVGTVSVEKSELLSKLLVKRDIPHEILNAKNHAREAQIIESAGQHSKVTISTNMAGRGTDIVLGEGVAALGGLYVIATERHESRRIDNQLRGRSGRQGDQGESKFFLSLEDDLMRIFASDRLSAIMGRLGMKEGEAIISPMVTRAIQRAQRRVEEHNFSSRKHLLEYDDVMNQQRQVIYQKRRNLLEGHGAVDFINDGVGLIASRLIASQSPETSEGNSWQLDKLGHDLSAEFGLPIQITGIEHESLSTAAVESLVVEQVAKAYKLKGENVGDEGMKKIECYVYLQIIDTAWKNHLLAMDALKDSVSLRGYGQRDPLQEYKKEAFRLFESLMNRIEEETVLALVRMPPPTLVMDQPLQDEPDEEELSFRHPDAGSATALAAGAAQGPAPAPSGLQPARGPTLGGRPPQGSSEDNLIYHGSRSQPAPKAAPKVQPFVRGQEKVGRNDPCPCGSGKKFKKCHGVEEGAGSSDQA